MLENHRHLCTAVEQCKSFYCYLNIITLGVCDVFETSIHKKAALYILIYIDIFQKLENIRKCKMQMKPSTGTPSKSRDSSSTLDRKNKNAQTEENVSSQNESESPSPVSSTEFEYCRNVHI